MNYFDKIFDVLMQFKVVALIIGAGFAAVVISFCINRSNAKEKINPDEELFPWYQLTDILDVDYDHYNEMGFTNLFGDSNQDWLDSIQDKSEYQFIHFDGVEFGKNETGGTDYSLSFCQVSDFDDNASYEVYVYSATTLRNIKGRLGSDQCHCITNDKIRKANGSFRLNLLNDDTNIPYILVECIEYKNEHAKIYDRCLIADECGHVSVYRVSEKE